MPVGRDIDRAGIAGKTDRNIFGVYDDKNLANNRVEEMKSELYSEEMKKNT